MSGANYPLPGYYSGFPYPYPYAPVAYGVPLASGHAPPTTAAHAGQPAAAPGWPPGYPFPHAYPYPYPYPYPMPAVPGAGHSVGQPAQVQQPQRPPQAGSGGLVSQAAAFSHSTGRAPPTETGVSAGSGRGRVGPVAPAQGKRESAQGSRPKDGLPKTAAEGLYSCTPCDRGFDSARDLAAHTAGHTHCEHPGCTFAAQRKRVLEHVKTAHRVEGQAQEGDGGAVRDAAGRVLLPPALLDLIPPRYRSAAAVGDSEEEITRWREERKRKYPTAEQAQVKKAQADARAERGGLVDNGRHAGSRLPLLPHHAVHCAAAGGRAPRPHAPPHAASPSQGGSGHKRAREKVGQEEDAAPGTEVVDAGEEEDEEPPEELPSGPSAAYAGPPLPAGPPVHAGGTGQGQGGGRKRQKEICKQYVFGGCTAGARCQYAHSAEAEAASSARPGRALLSKLLASEQEKETSITLQAIRYIVREGFFAGGVQAGQEAGEGSAL